MDDSFGKEALVTAESVTVHISSVYCVDVDFNFSLFIFRQERKTDEAWFIQQIVPAATTLDKTFVWV